MKVTSRLDSRGRKSMVQDRSHPPKMPVVSPAQDHLNWHCSNHEDITQCSKDCAFQAVLGLFSKKFTLPIIRLLLLKKTMRFNEIQSNLGASPKTITQRLQDLVHCGLIVRNAFNEVPMRVEYSLTPAAQGLEDIFERISLWTQHWTRPENEK